MKKWEHGGNIYSLPKDVLDFSANTNPLGMPIKAKQAIIDNIDNYEIYPDIANTELVVALAKHHNVLEENIVCSNGAAEIIYKIVNLKKPKKALIISPTFCEYEKALLEINCNCHHLILQNDFTADSSILDSITTEYDIMFICNPNNPTGHAVKKKLMLQILERCQENNVILVVDECFSDFIINQQDYSILEAVSSYKNLIILKAFTKIFAMAGLRLGYAVVGDTETCSSLREFMTPWSVSTVALKAGVGALEQENFIHETKIYVNEQNQYLKENLATLGLKVYNSKANYIFFKGGKNLKQQLLEKDILIRCCSNYIGLQQGYYRIAVKKQQENQRLIEALKQILKEQGEL